MIKKIVEVFLGFGLVTTLLSVFGVCFILERGAAVFGLTVEFRSPVAFHEVHVPAEPHEGERLARR